MTNKNLYLIVVILIAISVTGCGNGNKSFDATGTFEAEEVIVSAEVPGILQNFTLEDGQILKQKQVVGVIDTIQLTLRKKQLQAQIKAVLSKQPDAATQLATIQKQIETAQREQARFTKLVAGNSASQKQLDDITANLELLQKQYKASQSSLNITISGLQAEVQPLQAQIDQIDDQVRRSVITNPIDGTVLTRYVRQSELASAGKALYKVADLSTLILRAYVSGNQMATLKIGQNVRVFVDDGKEGFREMTGQITWISAKSEFTPKTIQTKDERANLVYAVKISVKNDGLLKIGMYGEVKF
ncbi:MAG: HlyD family efflux transporter periplasmic adaptor subunit [Ignavibacteria bacterium]|nr:HlyD family efflux transporter periplasmic adaptor subunit [Ignavibacteria bacterium]